MYWNELAVFVLLLTKVKPVGKSAETPVEEHGQQAAETIQKSTEELAQSTTTIQTSAEGLAQSIHDRAKNEEEGDPLQESAVKLVVEAVKGPRPVREMK